MLYFGHVWLGCNCKFMPWALHTCFSQLPLRSWFYLVKRHSSSSCLWSNIEVNVARYFKSSTHLILFRFSSLSSTMLHPSSDCSIQTHLDLLPSASFAHPQHRFLSFYLFVKYCILLIAHPLQKWLPPSSIWMLLMLIFCFEWRELGSPWLNSCGSLFLNFPHPHTTAWASCLTNGMAKACLLNFWWLTDWIPVVNHYSLTIRNNCKVKAMKIIRLKACLKI